MISNYIVDYMGNQQTQLVERGSRIIAPLSPLRQSTSFIPNLIVQLISVSKITFSFFDEQQMGFKKSSRDVFLKKILNTLWINCSTSFLIIVAIE